MSRMSPEEFSNRHVLCVNGYSFAKVKSCLNIVGDGNTIRSGEGYTVKGDENTVNGDRCTVTGNNNIVNGKNNTIEGNGNEVSGYYNTVDGVDNKLVSGQENVAIGRRNVDVNQWNILEDEFGYRQAGMRLHNQRAVAAWGHYWTYVEAGLTKVDASGSTVVVATENFDVPRSCFRSRR